LPRIKSSRSSAAPTAGIFSSRPVARSTRRAPPRPAACGGRRTS